MSVAVLTDLTKSYGAELIFSGVSFRIESRDRIGLVGPNGAGKTTLLHLLAGRLQPDVGSVSFAERVSVGYLPQVAEFTPHHTLFEEMLTVFDAVRGWEDELHALAARLSDPDLLADEDAYQAMLDALRRFTGALRARGRLHAGAARAPGAGWPRLHARAAGGSGGAPQRRPADARRARQAAAAAA